MSHAHTCGPSIEDTIGNACLHSFQHHSILQPSFESASARLLLIKFKFWVQLDRDASVFLGPFRG